MDEKIKEDMFVYLSASIEKENWSIDDVSSYGMAPTSGGVYVLTLWKTGKTEAKGKRSMKIKLDKHLEHMFLAVRTLEEIMRDHGPSNDFSKRIGEDKDPNQGFGIA